MSIELEDDVWCFKIVIAGEASVGKTTLVNRYIADKFTSEYKATIGVDIFTRDVILQKDDNLHVRLLVWDIAGQSLFRGFRRKFFENARSALLVFDLTAPRTLNLLDIWIKDILEVAGDVPLILIGNKSDLEELIEFEPEEISNFIDQHSNIVLNYNTSALSGENVEAAFLGLISQLM
ncbi:MAG: Rab family GTPase [Promethearchaeota archaeon]